MSGLVIFKEAPWKPRFTAAGEQREGSLMVTPMAILDVAVPALTMAVVLAVVLVALSGTRDSFRLPDDSINYVFTQTFAETGKLYYEEPYTPSDEENLLHPRGALSHDGRIVPVYFFGLPVLYAPVWLALGEETRYVAVVLSPAIVAILANAGGSLAPDRRWLAWLMVLGATPLVYMFSRPFLNVLPALLFLSMGANFLLRYAASEHGDRRYLLAASAAFALAAFMRYELVIFQTLLVLLVAYHKREDPRAILKDAALYGGATATLFVLPVLMLNQIVYGSPLTYGYGLLNETFFPERAGIGAFPSSLIERARSVLLPTYEVDLKRAASAFVFQIAGVAPLFVALGMAGAWAAVRTGRASKPVVLGAAALAVYVYLYRGAGLSLHAENTLPNLEASVQRYSMPLYVACYFLSVYALGRLRWQWAAGIAVVVGAVGLGSAVRGWDGNIQEVRYWVDRSDTEVRAPLLQHTEAGAIIYTDAYDKVLGLDRDVATWWGGSRGTMEEGFFQPAAVARSIGRVIDERPVYLYFADSDYVMPRLEPALNERGLTATPAGFAQLYRVERARPNVR